MRGKLLQDETFRKAPPVGGTNFEAMLAYYRRTLLPLKILPPNPRCAFGWESDFAPGPGVSVLRARYTSSLTYGSDNGTENLNLSFLTAGASELVIGARAVEQTPSCAMVYAQPTLTQQTMHAIDGEVGGIVVRFDAGLVTRLLIDMFEGARLTSLDLAPAITLSTSVGQTLRSLARALDGGLRDERLLLRSPLAMTLVAEGALRLILTEVPHRLSARLAGQDADPAYRQIKHAIGYMRANLHLPITVTDIANAAGISSRSLQLGFRRHYEMSPTQLLRRIRLEAAQAELSSPRNTLPVSEVALKWGFTNIGRFAAHYRAEFGHLPSDAVRRASPRR